MPFEIDNEEVDERTMRCRACDRKLQQGMDVTTLQRGVLGVRGLIPLEDLEYFCCRTCLEEHCCDGLEEPPYFKYDEKD